MWREAILELSAQCHTPLLSVTVTVLISRSICPTLTLLDFVKSPPLASSALPHEPESASQPPTDGARAMLDRRQKVESHSHLIEQLVASHTTCQLLSRRVIYTNLENTKINTTFCQSCKWINCNVYTAYKVSKSYCKIN